ncbi:hypothetical protein ACW23B_04340 [Streptomyces albidoflavus]
MPRLPFGEWVDSGVDWLQNNLAWLFDAISAVVKGLNAGINAVLTAPEPLLLAGIFAVIAWWLRGLLAGARASSDSASSSRWSCGTTRWPRCRWCWLPPWSRSCCPCRSAYGRPAPAR